MLRDLWFLLLKAADRFAVAFAYGVGIGLALRLLGIQIILAGTGG